MRLRPLALPYEHGAWGFLLEPIAVGLLVAPSRGGALVALGTIAAFLMRHPLRLGIGDWIAHKHVPRTRVCFLLALGYGLAALAAFAFVGLRPLIPLAFALPMAATQFAFDVRNRGRARTAELAGALAAGWSASAIVLAGARPPALAIALWVLLAARAWTSVFYVRSTLRGESRPLMLAMHAIAIVAAMILAWRGYVSALAVTAMAVLLARALPATGNLRARDIGIRELGYGALTVLLIAIA